MTMKKRDPIKKLLSVLTIFSFLGSPAGWGLPASGLSITPQTEQPNFLEFQIPAELASVEEIYEAPPQEDPKLILHIQNAHGNYEAQSKIKQLLEYLNSQYGFDLLFVEGAAEELNADLLKLFPEKEHNIQLADYLTKQGELTGAELYLMDAPESVRAVGIENQELYRANYEAFRAIHENRDRTDDFMMETEQKLETIASRIFSSDTRRILSEWKKFEEGHRDFLPFVRQLANDSKKILGVDLESLFSQVEWPQMTRLLVLQSMERELNRTLAEKEREALLGFLAEKGIPEGLIRQVRELGEKKISMTRLDEAKTDHRHLPRYLLERLIEEAGPKGFQFHQYPSFSLYAGYLIIQSELESRALFTEIERMFRKILDELTVTELEKNLLELFRDSGLLKKLFHLELMRTEWARAYYRRNWIEPSNISHRLVTLRSEMESLFRFQSDEKNPAITTMQASQVLKGERKDELKRLFDLAFHFYDLARQREVVFYETMRNEMKRSEKNKAVLITGGFHTEGLSEIFRREQVSYGTLMPRMTQEIDNVNYISTMLETRSTMFDVATIEAILTMLDDRARLDMGARGDQKLKVVVDAYFQVLREANLIENLEVDLPRYIQFFNDSSFAKRYRVRIAREAETTGFVGVIERGENDAFRPLVINGKKVEINFKQAQVQDEAQLVITPKGVRQLIEQVTTQVGELKVTAGRLPAATQPGTQAAGRELPEVRLFPIATSIPAEPDDAQDRTFGEPEFAGLGEQAIPFSQVRQGLSGMAASASAQMQVLALTNGLIAVNPSRARSELRYLMDNLLGNQVSPQLETLIARIAALEVTNTEAGLAIVSDQVPDTFELNGLHAMLATQLGQRVVQVAVAKDEAQRAQMREAYEASLAGVTEAWVDVEGKDILADKRFVFEVILANDLGKFLQNVPRSLFRRMGRLGDTVIGFQQNHFAILYDFAENVILDTTLAVTVERPAQVGPEGRLISSVIGSKVSQATNKTDPVALREEVAKAIGMPALEGRRNFRIISSALRRIAELWTQALRDYHIARSA